MPSTPTDELFVGLMSGTSVDGIDVALCRFGPQPRLMGANTVAWPESLRPKLLAAATNAPMDPDTPGHLDTAAGACFAEAVRDLLASTGTPATSVRAIGSHGQTLRHVPEGPHPFTLQIGNPWVIAETCRIDTVADFRRADIAAGGQGAPLMPAFHAAVLARPDENLAVLNLGGIANVTVIAPDGRVTGFDTGPANGLLDAWCQRQRGTAFDRDGAFAGQGQCDAGLLEAWLDDPYFRRTPPKSTGRDHFDLTWLLERLPVESPAPEDVQATLLALTVQTITDAIVEHARETTHVLVCGGGVHNKRLMQALTRQLAPRRVESTATRGIDPDYVEAMGFAWLARQHLAGKPGNLPAVTGASGPRVLGTLFAAPGANHS